MALDRKRQKTYLRVAASSLFALASLFLGTIFNLIDASTHLVPVLVGVGALVILGLIALISSNVDGKEPAGTTEPAHPVAGPPATSFKHRRVYMAQEADGFVVVRRGLVEQTVAALTRADLPELTILFGPGGFGKTTLAQLVCASPGIDQHFPGGVLWVQLGPTAEGTQLTALIAGLCRRLSGAQESFPDAAQAGSYLAELLEERAAAGFRTLLVIDDVTSAAQLAPFQHGKGLARLVTTRIASLLPERSVSVGVEELSADEARELLTRELPPIAPGLVAELLTLTGRWALPTSLVNAYLRREAGRPEPDVEESARRLVARMREEGPAAAEIRTARGQRTTIGATIRSSLAAFEEEERRRFQELAVFPADIDVPVDVVRLLWEGTAAMTPGETDRLCLEFDGLSLFTSFAPQRALRLHTVIRDYLRHEPESDLPRCHAALLDAAARHLLPAPTEGEPRPWWRLPTDQGYLWRHVAFHLNGAGLHAELRELALDLRWAAGKSALIGVGEVEADLRLADSPTARVLRQVWVREAHVLQPIQPPNSHADIIVSRLGVVPELERTVKAFTATLPTGVTRLRNFWPLPDASHDSRRLLAHPGTVLACAFEPGGAWLATGAHDGTLRLWDLATASESQVLAGHTDAISGVAVAPDGSWAATSSQDGTARIWDLGPAGPTARRILAGHAARSWVTGVAIFPDGTRLATSGLDGTVRIWDAVTGAEVLTLVGHTDGVTGVAVSRDGTWLATSSNDRSVRLWDAHTGALRTTLREHKGAVLSVAISPDGTWLASGSTDSEIRIWDVGTGLTRRVLADHTDWVRTVAISPDGAWLASGGEDKSVRVWNVEKGVCTRNLTGHEFSVRGVAISRDSSGLASAGEDGTVRLWEVAEAPTPATRSERMAMMRGVAFAPAGTWLATSGYDRTVRIWDAATGASRSFLAGHTGWVSGVAIAPDGTWLATSSHDGTVRTWDAATDLPRRTLTGHEGWVRDVAISPDGTWLASVGVDHTVRVWDAATGHQRWSGRSASAGTAVAISPDGARLATGGQDGSIWLWDAVTGKHLDTLGDRTGWVTGVDISPDGTWLAASGEDRAVLLWDLASRTVRAALYGHTETASGVAISPDGSKIATTGLDNTLRVYSTAGASGGPEALAAMRVDGDLLAGCWSRDGAVVYVVGARGVYAFSVDRT